MTPSERSLLLYFIDSLCAAPDQFYDLCKLAEELGVKRSQTEYLLKARTYIIKFIESSNLVGENAPTNGNGIYYHIYQMLKKTPMPESLPEADAWDMMLRITH